MGHLLYGMYKYDLSSSLWGGGARGGGREESGKGNYVVIVPLDAAAREREGEQFMGLHYAAPTIFISFIMLHSLLHGPSGPFSLDS
jgi:hypothetical protein